MTFEPSVFIAGFGTGFGLAVMFITICIISKGGEWLQRQKREK